MTIRLIETRYGGMYVPDTDFAQFPWYENAGASPEDQHIQDVIDLLAERKPGLFVDCGANFGCWTLALAPHCKGVLAFEPQKNVAELLWDSIKHNGLEKRVTLAMAALGATTGGRVQIERLDLEQPANFGGLALGETLGQQESRPWDLVELVCLDDSAHPGVHVSFIKIDVEGSEINVIKGAKKTIEHSRPLMFVEIHHKNTDTPELIRQIEAFGYVLEQRGPNALCVPL